MTELITAKVNWSVGQAEDGRSLPAVPEWMQGGIRERPCRHQGTNQQKPCAVTSSHPGLCSLGRCRARHTSKQGPGIKMRLHRQQGCQAGSSRWWLYQNTMEKTKKQVLWPQTAFEKTNWELWGRAPQCLNCLAMKQSRLCLARSPAKVVRWGLYSQQCS